MFGFGKNSKRAKRRREQEEKLRRFKEEIQEVPLERNDYLAMVLGAFWALWPVLAIVAGVVLCVCTLLFQVRKERNMKFGEFVYKRTDVDEVRNRIREITEELKHASSLEEQIQAVYKMNEVEKEISTADSLVYIRYTINTKNEFYAKEREYNDRISPMLEEEFQKYNEVLLQSRFRRELEEKFGKVLFLNLELAMKGFSPEITELLQEESRLQTQYQTLLAGAQIEFQGKTYNLSQLGPYAE